MSPESAEPEKSESGIFSITCGRKPKVTIPKKRANKKETVVDVSLSDLIAILSSETKVTVSRAWAISIGLKADSADSSQEKAQEVKKSVDVKKEIPTVSTYDFDTDDLP